MFKTIPGQNEQLPLMAWTKSSVVLFEKEEPRYLAKKGRSVIQKRIILDDLIRNGTV